LHNKSFAHAFTPLATRFPRHDRHLLTMVPKPGSTMHHA
jgi:hypothetical protein